MNHKDAKHFTWDQRLTLERMLKKGFTKAAIASALGKCERSIYYEINRGLCVQQTSGYEFIEQTSGEDFSGDWGERHDGELGAEGQAQQTSGEPDAAQEQPVQYTDLPLDAEGYPVE